MSLYNKSGSRQQQNPVVTNRNGDVLTPDDAPTISFPTLLPQSPSNDVGSLGSPWRDGHFSGQVKSTSAAIVGSLTAGTVTASQFIGGLIPASDLLPLTTAQYNIGSAVNTWNNIYWSGIAYGGGLSLSAQATVRDILPATTALYSIGSNATRFQDGFFNGTVTAATCTASLFKIADGFTVRIGDANTSPADSGAVAIGASAGKNFAGSLAASTSTAVGYQALYTTAGANNTGVGCAAGYNIGSGAFDNIALGYNACMGNDAGMSGSYNIGIGRLSNRNLSSGSDNIAIGHTAGQCNTTGSGNVLIGRGAGAGLGTYAVSDCVGVGHQSLNAVASGATQLTAVGSRALRLATTGTGLCAFGYNAGTAITTANTATCIGHQAAASLATANNVTAIGASAGQFSLGADNTFVGFNAGLGVVSTTTGTANVGIGSGAMAALTTGATNVAIGSSAGSALTTGASNVVIGANNTMANCATGSGNVYVGASIATTVLTNNATVIGSSNSIGHNGCIVIGQGITTAVANTLHIGSATTAMATATTVGAAGGGSALPATPVTYLIAFINGTQYKIPLYNP